MLPLTSLPNVLHHLVGNSHADSVQIDFAENVFLHGHYIILLLVERKGLTVATRSPSDDPDLQKDLESLNQDSSSTDVAAEPEDKSLPEGLRLQQNYPNPFNPETRLQYELPFSGYIKQAVCDVLGHEVKEW